MPDEYENEESQGLDLDRYLDIARRRFMQFLLPLLAGFLLVWGASWVLKPRYKSTTVILVEQPSMPKNYVLPNVGEDLQDQLASISEQVMSRSRLLAIIDRYHLYPTTGKRLTPDEEVADMGRNIDVELVHGDPTRDSGAVTSFSIGYTGKSPFLAQQITRELADTVMNQNLAIRQRESQDTTQFLDQQLQAASQTLAEQEAKVKAYEAAHEGSLPSQQQSNLQVLMGLQSQLQSEQDSLNAAVQQRAYDQTLIEQYRALRGPVRTADGVSVDVATLNQTLEKERAQLADLRSRYTDNYPDVQELRSEIARTEKERDQALAAAKANPSKDGGDAGDASGTQNAPLAQLQGQLKANQLEIANRQQAIAQLKARIGQYQGRLGGEPASEQELADLTRGYEQSKENYDELLKKRDDSQMATSMEQMQQGERFSVLEPATLPWKPDFPNRLKFCAMGIGFGLFLGLAFVFVCEYLDDRMYNDKAIKDLLPIAVISEVPEIETEEDQRRARKRAFMGWATAAVVAVTILGSAAVSVLHR